MNPIQKSAHLTKAKELYSAYEHLTPSIFFVGGFLLDIFTLGRVDDLTNIITLSLYLFLSLFCFAIELRPIEKPGKFFKFLNKYRDEIFHFSQGALLSAFTLFYFKSASLSTSLLFLLFMIAILLLNELPATQKLGALIKGALFNLSLLSFCLVYVPQIGGRVGTIMFLASISTFALILGLLVWVLLKNRFDSFLIKQSLLAPGLIIAIVFILLRTFKFMPPVPLSLQQAGIYHKIVKKYPRYELYHEKKWWKFWHKSDETFKARVGDKLYFFTRVFAPGGFKDRIIVHWQVYEAGNWLTSDKIPLSILGGREEGYRGIAYKSNYRPGLWRVKVETTSGLEIGRLNFEVIASVEKAERNFTLEVN